MFFFIIIIIIIVAGTPDGIRIPIRSIANVLHKVVLLDLYSGPSEMIASSCLATAVGEPIARRLNVSRRLANFCQGQLVENCRRTIESLVRATTQGRRHFQPL